MSLKAQVEKTATIHYDMAANLSDQAQRITQIRESQATRCKQAEYAVKQCQNQKKELYTKTKSVCYMYTKTKSVCYMYTKTKSVSYIYTKTKSVCYMYTKG